MHCLRTHKFHFLSIFSLKMGLTSLFTHLKIILLQCFQFSVFSFSKISSIQTHPVIMCHLFYVFSISSFILQCFLAFMLFECKLSCIKALQVVKIFMLFECKFIKASRASLRTGGGTMGTWVWLSAFHCVNLHGWTTPNVW